MFQLEGEQSRSEKDPQVLGTDTAVSRRSEIPSPSSRVTQVFLRTPSLSKWDKLWGRSLDLGPAPGPPRACRAGLSL